MNMLNTNSGKQTQLVIFLLILWLPFTGLFFQCDYFPKLYENRRLTSISDISASDIDKFPGIFDKYFNDHFGFRNSFIKIYNYINIFILKHSTSRKVIFGKNGYLFFAGEDLSYNKYTEPFSILELNRLRANIVYNYVTMKKTGIHYLFLSPPNKQSIYPEYLFEPYRSWDRVSRYDQLSMAMNPSGSDFFIDLKDKIIRAKNQGKQVYFKTDTHWNDEAAFIAYKCIMEKINHFYHDITIMKEYDFNRCEKDYSGDMPVNMLALGKEIKEKTIRLQEKAPYSHIRKFFGPQEYNGKNRYHIVTSENTKGFPAMVLVRRDSQFDAIIPWFSETFSKVVYVNVWEEKSFVKDLIDSVQPDLFIDEIVERSIPAIVNNALVL